MEEDNKLPLYRVIIERKFTNSVETTRFLLRADGHFQSKEAGKAEANRWNDLNPIGPRWALVSSEFVDEKKLNAGEVVCID